MPTRSITADRGDAGLRLDLVLRRHLHDVSVATRTRVQRWIEDGLVTVNGAMVPRPSARAAFGDVVAVELPDAKPAEPSAAEDAALHVLYEDAWLLAVNKPAGLVVHPTHRNTAGTLFNVLLGYARAWPAPNRPSLVGRLDKLTTGVVIVAKNAAAHTALQRALASPATEKHYLAVVYGRVNRPSGEIDLCLRRDPGDRRRVVAAEGIGAPSLTRFTRLARAAAPRVGLSLVRCELVTGRTHQIRVHMAARGWPLVGDPMYGEPRWSRVTDPALADTLRTFPRQALHAWHLTFMHPMTHTRMTIAAPIPDDLQALITTAGLTVPQSLASPGDG